jgi:hypothetical protein
MPFISKKVTSLEKQEFNDYRDLFNINHPIYFLERYKDYTEHYCYAAETHNSEIVNFYLENIDILEKFKFYFKDKARKLIKYSENNRLLIPDKMFLQFDNKLIPDKNEKQKTFHELRPDIVLYH